MASTDLGPVSVVIPTYNRADLLRAALESVLAQTVPVQEIVVVDDGSTDHTPDVVRDLAAAGAPITCIALPHRNQRSAARNRGAAATTSPLVAFLDSDDLWLPWRLERQLDVWARAPRAGFAFCNVQRFDEQGVIGPLPCLHPAADYNGAILDRILVEPLAISSTLIVRRALFDRLGGFAPMRTNEDYELTLRLAAASRASYVPEVLVHMREHAGRTSRIQREIPLLDYIDLVTRFLAAHPHLPAHTRAQGRRGIANVHFKLARLYLETGDRVAARRHLWAFARLRPWDRRGPAAWLRAWGPFGARRGPAAPAR
jgi:glycosyltransferase involved in cell wall biosynthesis